MKISRTTSKVLKLFLFVCLFCLFLIFHLASSKLITLAKWSNTLKQFVSKLPTNCLSVIGHFFVN